MVMVNLVMVMGKSHYVDCELGHHTVRKQISLKPLYRQSSPEKLYIESFKNLSFKTSYEQFSTFTGGV